MWAVFSQSVRPAMGGEQLIFAFIVVIIGGLGSVTGSLVGALLVGLSYNYVAFLRPQGGPRREHGAHGAGAARAPDRALRAARVSAAAGSPRCRPRVRRRAAALAEPTAFLRLGVLLACALVPLVAPSFQTHRPRAQDRALRHAGRELRRGDRLHRHRVLRPRHVLRLRRLRGGARGGQARRAHLRPSRSWASSSASWSRPPSAVVIGAFSLRVKAHLLRHDHAGLRGVRASSWPCSGARSPAARTGCRRSCRASSPAGRVRRSSASLTRPARHLLHGARGVPGAASSLMRRFVHSPLGRTLQAIRDNELRAEALGYRTFVFQLVASSFAQRGRDGARRLLHAVGALREPGVGPRHPDHARRAAHGDHRRHRHAVRGHRGRRRAAHRAHLAAQPPRPGRAVFAGSEILQRLSERWLLYFGILFILVVFFFPRGVLGTLREVAARRRRAGAREA